MSIIQSKEIVSKKMMRLNKRMILFLSAVLLMLVLSTGCKNKETEEESFGVVQVEEMTDELILHFRGYPGNYAVVNFLLLCETEEPRNPTAYRLVGMDWKLVLDPDTGVIDRGNLSVAQGVLQLEMKFDKPEVSTARCILTHFGAEFPLPDSDFQFNE